MIAIVEEVLCSCQIVGKKLLPLYYPRGKIIVVKLMCRQSAVIIHLKEKKKKKFKLQDYVQSRPQNPLFIWLSLRTRTLATSKAGSPQITDFRLCLKRSEI